MQNLFEPFSFSHIRLPLAVATDARLTSGSMVVVPYYIIIIKPYIRNKNHPMIYCYTQCVYVRIYIRVNSHSDGIKEKKEKKGEKRNRTILRV